MLTSTVVRDIIMEEVIGKKIKKIRLSKNMSQERFGYKIGVSGKSISAYENGACTPSLRVMEALSSVYNASFISTPDRKELLNKLSLLKVHIDELEKTLSRSLSL